MPLFLLLYPLARSAALTITLTTSLTQDYCVNLSWKSNGDNSRFAYTPWHKSSYVLSNEWHSLTTVDFEKDTVKVLNIYPDVSGEEMVDMTYGTSTVVHRITKAAAAKVWMEGGTITEGGTKTTFEAAGRNPFGNHNQIVKVDGVTMADYGKKPSMIWNYDVIFLGTWDANGAWLVDVGPNLLNQAGLNEIEKYIRKRYGVLAGHDTIVGSGRISYGLAPLRNYFNISVQSDTPCSFCDNGGRWHYISNKVQVDDVKGGLTMWPHKLNNYPNNVMEIPESHTVDNAAMGKIWMSFYAGKYHEWATPAVPKKRYTFFLTTNDCTAMIQTGHSKCQSTEDERKIIANTIYYLKQRAPSPHSLVDRTATDRVAPTKPTCTFTKSGHTIHYTCKAQDQACLYYHLVRGYDTNQWQVFSPSNIVRTDVRSGVGRFSWWVDNTKTSSKPSQLNSVTAKSDSATSSFVSSGQRYFHVFATDRAGNAGEVSTYGLSTVTTLKFSPLSKGGRLASSSEAGIFCSYHQYIALNIALLQL